MKVVKVEDLNVGDKIIVSSNTKLKFMVVVKPPVLGKPRGWRPNDPNWKSVKCSLKVRTKVIMYGHYQKNLKEYIPTFENHDGYCYANLNYKNIILIEEGDNYENNQG